MSVRSPYDSAVLTFKCLEVLLSFATGALTALVSQWSVVVVDNGSHGGGNQGTCK